MKMKLILDKKTEEKKIVKYIPDLNIGDTFTMFEEGYKVVFLILELNNIKYFTGIAFIDEQAKSANKIYDGKIILCQKFSFLKVYHVNEFFVTK
jgi:hypothetical protein